jgi:hypothetical protein
LGRLESIQISLDNFNGCRKKFHVLSVHNYPGIFPSNFNQICYQGATAFDAYYLAEYYVVPLLASSGHREERVWELLFTDNYCRYASGTVKRHESLFLALDPLFAFIKPLSY